MRLLGVGSDTGGAKLLLESQSGRAMQKAESTSVLNAYKSAQPDVGNGQRRESVSLDPFANVLRSQWDFC